MRVGDGETSIFALPLRRSYLTWQVFLRSIGETQLVAFAVYLLCTWDRTLAAVSRYQ